MLLLYDWYAAALAVDSAVQAVEVVCRRAGGLPGSGWGVALMSGQDVLYAVVQRAGVFLADAGRLVVELSVFA